MASISDPGSRHASRPVPESHPTAPQERVMKSDGVQTGEKRRRGSSAPLRHAAGVTNDTLSHHKETRRAETGPDLPRQPPRPDVDLGHL